MKPFDRRTFLKAACAACGQAMVLGAPDAWAQKNTAGFPVSGKHAKKAYFFKDLGGTVQCQTCPHECMITPGHRGKCGTKINLDGVLYSISYGNPCTVHPDPVEKKPLTHFHPGSKAFSLAVAGCNFTCLNCQNWEISQTTPDKTRNYDLPCERVVALARKYGCQSIAYTYSEATTFYEYMFDTSKLAHEHGLKNVWVSNAYMKPAAVEKLCQVIDAASLNFKSFSDETYRTLNGGRLDPVLTTYKIVKEHGVWLELINLIVPTYTDDMDEIRGMCAWIAENLGPDTPLHFSRFFPKYRLVHLPPTPVQVMEQAREVAQEEGLLYVYLGNVSSDTGTVFCDACKSAVVERRGYRLVGLHLDQGRCDGCGHPIPGRWDGMSAN